MVTKLPRPYSALDRALLQGTNTLFTIVRARVCRNRKAHGAGLALPLGRLFRHGKPTPAHGGLFRALTFRRCDCLQPTFADRVGDG